MPMLIVQRAEPEGVATKGTKSGKTRRVPVADRVLPIVHELRAGREPDALLCVTATGHQLHATTLKRTLGWAAIADGRRIQDLRHTAACLWLARGVDAATVQAWMGHASIATTNLYLHHLGTASDRAGLARLNQAAGCMRGARGGLVAEMQKRETEEDEPSDLVRSDFDVGGAKGTRTPDLLVAKAPPARLVGVRQRPARCMRCIATHGSCRWGHTGGHTADCWSGRFRVSRADRAAHDADPHRNGAEPGSVVSPGLS